MVASQERPKLRGLRRHERNGARTAVEDARKRGVCTARVPRCGRGGAAASGGCCSTARHPAALLRPADITGPRSRAVARAGTRHTEVGGAAEAPGQPARRRCCSDVGRAAHPPSWIPQPQAKRTVRSVTAPRRAESNLCGPRVPSNEGVASLHRSGQTNRVTRARTYLLSVPPGVAGEHGHTHTFRMCCRVVRGFALSEHDALAALVEWNERCVPPWPASHLAAKVRNAGRYGREPLGARVLEHGCVPTSRYCG